MSHRVPDPVVRAVLPSVFLLFLLLPAAAPAAQSPEFRIAIPELSSPPKIDGRLDNPLWDAAVRLENFTQFEPQEGAKPSERTTAYLGHDRHNLYIAFRCYDSNPKAVRACLAPRDQVRGDDGVAVYLDTFNDRKRAFVFEVNPCGIQSDGVFAEGGGGGRRGRGGFDPVDRNWNTHFLAHAELDDQGYTVEMAIPFKSLRFPAGEKQVWGLQLMRSIRRKNEEIFWAPRSRDINGFLVQAGQIEIPGLIDRGGNLEIMPVLTGLAENGGALKAQPGLNFKYGLKSNLTVDATINPDFSQVEADMPQVDVNRRYALYFPETRPFFLEGKDFFDTPIEVVYSRKIIEPLWGLKLTSRMGRMTLGFMTALDEDPAPIDITGAYSNGAWESDAPLGRSLVSAFRLKHDLFSESFLGLVFTDKEMGPSTKNITADHNRVAGLDGHFKFLNNYRFSFQLLGSDSRVEGEGAGLRPAWSLNLSRASRHLNVSLDWTSIDPEFEAAAGFLRRKDIHSLNSRLSYSFLPQNDLLISFSPLLQYRRTYDFSRNLTDEEYSVGMFFNGWRQTTLWLNWQTGMERYEGRNFRGSEFRCFADSEPLSWLQAGLSFELGDGIYYSEDPYLGWKSELGVRMTLRPLASLRLALNLQDYAFYKERGGDKEYQVSIYSLRTSYQLSKPLSVRLVTDYNSYYDRVYLSFLFSYELRPGTVVYFGLDQDRGVDDTGIMRRDRYLFLKFSYWWRA
ncbi:MAG: carbohydrate binding family 9 domain-containing protein [Candidatus Aminicenantes bacterium]|nr:carbohydrate binding family 9 domain-containing protein [Candidatus Aminicenantes bacterium]